MHKLGDVRKALDAGELDEALARLTCGADPAAARRRVAALLDGFRAELWQGRGYTCDPVLRPGPHGDLRQPHRPSARPGAGRGGERGLFGLRGSQRHRHHSLPVGGLAHGGGGAGRPGAQERTRRRAPPPWCAAWPAQAAQRGYPVAGFDVYAVSDVLPGSGLSSSAACEVLLGVIENHLFCNGRAQTR